MGEISSFSYLLGIASGYVIRVLIGSYLDERERQREQRCEELKQEILFEVEQRDG